jgi:imidazole glycerol-phosphate synthase subunit HisH
VIVIVEACGNNFASVEFAIERLGKKTQISHDPAVIQAASHVILPGVGTAKQAMQQLQDFNLIEVIRNLKQPVLGICLGMQILYQSSAEGEVDCLKILSGEVNALPERENLSLPHMGWNQINFLQPSRLLKDVKDDSYLYYVHSFAAPVNEHSVAVTEYTIKFSAVVEKNNFYGMQFHPERSGNIGSVMLKNFLELT